jgi:methionine-rich copper-binding protein CopC
VALVIALIAFLSFPQSASGHVSVISTSPQYKSTVKHLPARVVIEFSSPLLVIGEKNSNYVEVINPNGAPATNGDELVEGSTISVALNKDRPVAGDYTVRYRVASTDGHAVSGSYHFFLSQGQLASQLPATEVTVEHGFWHFHRIHVLEGSAALFIILGWALYRARFAHGK